jgi:HEAT repeat protein
VVRSCALASTALLLATLVACSQGPTTSRPGATPRGGAGTPATAAVPTDPRLLRFHKVDMLIAQWDAAQSGTRSEQADPLATQIRAEVDGAFPDFVKASEGGEGAQLQYLGTSALGFSARPEATAALVARLTDPDPRLLGNALIALKLRADPATPIPPLLSLVPSRAAEPRRYAPLALAHVLDARRAAGHPVEGDTARSAASVLSGVVADRDPYVRLHVARALGALQGPGCVELLLVLMHDEYTRIRLAAAAALQRIGDPRGFPEVIRLLDQAEDDMKPVVRDVLFSYAERIEGGPLAEPDRAQLGTSALGWSRWFNEFRVRHGMDEAPGPMARPAVPQSPPAARPAPPPPPADGPPTGPLPPPVTR